MCARNMNVKGDSGKISDKNEEHVIGNWRKIDPCYKVTKNFVELCCNLLWKIELVSIKIGI